jgi:hypothetical protein
MVERMGVFSFHLCFEVNEGAKVMNMLKIFVDSPHLLHCPAIYLGEEMQGFYFILFYFVS